MIQLLAHLRAMQLFTHHAHNLVSRAVFFQDHDFFGEVYPQLESDYDSVIERVIGLQGEGQLALQQLLQAVVAKIASAPSVGVKENKVFFEYLLQQEQELCKLIEEICKMPGVSQGTIQTIATIGEKSEIRQYKIKQRVK
jgi:DNA-binding ferritin-like protein